MVPYLVEQDECDDLKKLDPHPCLSDNHESDLAESELKTLLGHWRYAQIAQHRRRDRGYRCSRVYQRVQRCLTLAFLVTDADGDAKCSHEWIVSDGGQRGKPSRRFGGATDLEQHAYAHLRLVTGHHLPFPLLLQRRVRIVPTEVIRDGAAAVEAAAGRRVQRS